MTTILWRSSLQTKMPDLCSCRQVSRKRNKMCDILFLTKPWLFQMPGIIKWIVFNPLKPSGNCMYHPSSQLVTMYFSSGFFIQTTSGAYPSSCTMVPGGLPSRVQCGWVIMLTSHPLLVPRLRKSRSCSSSPPCCLCGMYLNHCTTIVFVTVDYTFNVQVIYSICGRRSHKDESFFGVLHVSCIE
jgi:hypothetical protein